MYDKSVQNSCTCQFHEIRPDTSVVFDWNRIYGNVVNGQQTTEVIDRENSLHLVCVLTLIQRKVINFYAFIMDLHYSEWKRCWFEFNFSFSIFFYFLRFGIALCCVTTSSIWDNSNELFHLLFRIKIII